MSFVALQLLFLFSLSYLRVVCDSYRVFLTVKRQSLMRVSFVAIVCVFACHRASEYWFCVSKAAAFEMSDDGTATLLQLWRRDRWWGGERPLLIFAPQGNPLVSVYERRANSRKKCCTQNVTHLLR
jgi:hypothetical protein